MKSILHFFVVICCAVLLSTPSNAQEKSDNNEPAAAATNEGSAKPASTPEIRTLSGEHVYIAADGQQGIKPPRVLKSPDPVYPEAARQEQIEGTVVLWLVVNEQGLPEQIRVQRALGHGLDRNAVEAVKHWKFAPATKSGAPVAVAINVEVNFRLR